MKKISIICLTIMAISGMYSCNVLAYQTKVGETIGVVINLTEDILYIEGEPITSYGAHKVAVDISSTPIYDLLTGFPVTKQVIYNDMSVRIAYEISPSGKKNALVVWLNCGYEDSAVFTVVVSDNIQYGSDHCVFLCVDGKYRVTITPQTVIMNPNYNGEIFPFDIYPGQELFIWVDMITASSPSIVYPDKVVVIND